MKNILITILLFISFLGFSQQQKNGAGKVIYTWGDSMTAGTGATNGQTWQNQMFRWIDQQRYYKVFARGGITSTEIAYLAGGIPFRISVPSNNLTTSYQYLTYNSGRILGTNADTTSYCISGTVVAKTTSNVTVKLRTLLKRTGYDSSGVRVEKLRIRIPSGVSALNNSYVEPKSFFTPDDAVNSRGDINIIWAGVNDNKATLDTLCYNNIVSIVEKLENPKQFIVIGVIPATYMTTGTSDNSYIVAYNAKMKAKYPNNFVDMNPPTTDEMRATGFTYNSTDLAEIATGIFPTSMHSSGDQIHLNNAGYAIVAYRVAKVYNANGY